MKYEPFAFGLWVLRINSYGKPSPYKDIDITLANINLISICHLTYNKYEIVFSHCNSNKLVHRSCGSIFHVLRVALEKSGLINFSKHDTWRKKDSWFKQYFRTIAGGTDADKLYDELVELDRLNRRVRHKVYEN